MVIMNQTTLNYSKNHYIVSSNESYKDENACPQKCDTQQENYHWNWAIDFTVRISVFCHDTN